MSFSLPRFLRHVPVSSLQLYVKTRGYPGFDNFKWDSQPRALRRAMNEAIEALSGSERAQVFDDFERVEQLCNEIGQAAIRSALGERADLLVRLEDYDGDETRGLFLLLNAKEAFDQALATASASRLYHGRSWSGFDLPSPFKLDEGRLALDRLQQEIRMLSKALDGSGGKVVIDRFERVSPASLSLGEGRVIQFTAYIEGLPISALQFEKGEPKRQVRHPAVEAVICCDPDTGKVDVISKGGRSHRAKIAKAFARCLLGSEEGLKPLQRRRFHLDRLKRPRVFSHDPADGIKDVKLIGLRLSGMASDSGRLTIELDHSREDMQAATSRWFGNHDPLSSADWHVTMARLRITFHPEERGRKGKTLVVELRENSSNLRDQTRRHQLIAEKYLKRWQLGD